MDGRVFRFGVPHFLTRPHWFDAGAGAVTDAEPDVLKKVLMGIGV